ncbi:MAG: hypothetical protein ABSF14_07860 [Terriglobia bacterium]|jgi:hypothetical protein
MMYGIEFGLVLVAVALAFAFPHLGSRWFEAGERALGRLAERPRLAVVVAGLTALAARAALLPILPVPEPAVHDEFSYLLAADTFAHGRLSNPTHPLWIHFETFHVLWHPTYASMFPPAQGLILAFGQAVLGHPFWGVWLSLGLMCAALCWMLQGWLPPRWALLGGLLAVIRLATFSYWANSYWGGAVAATGGALVFGALPRLKQSLRVPDALLLGLGLAILANSRPYEGLVFSLPAGAALLAWMFGKNRPPLRESIRRVVLPTGLLLGLVAVLMGYYFCKVTGNPWRMPHQAYHETNLVTPYFLGQAPRPVPTYHHAVMKDYYLTFELPFWVQTRSLGGVVRQESVKAAQIWLFYVQPLFTLPLVMAIFVLPYGFSWRQISPGTRFLLMATGFGLAGYALEVYYNPHYPAPGTCLVFALVLGAMRYVRSWRWRQKPVGLAITRAIPLIGGALLVFSAAAVPRLLPREAWPGIWKYPGYRVPDRAPMLAQLEREPGRHLVIVRYSAAHPPELEWVYNRADIDGSKVVWARDMGREQNAELLRYFETRRIWLVEADLTPPRLSAYPSE